MYPQFTYGILFITTINIWRLWLILQTIPLHASTQNILLDCEFRQINCALDSADGNSLDTGTYVYVTGSGRKNTVTIYTR
jgi:hypothetical protein